MTENSTGLVAAPPRPPETPEEREATFRIAKALAESGFYKDARQPGQALAKILTGRDLGLSATESMGAFYVVNGKVEAVGDFHATRVRSTPGYDYDVEFSEDDEGETDGCKITLFGPKRGKEYEQLGVSTFTRKDAERAQLQDKDTYKQFPRNMYFNRAISNGVAWFCPEVMGAVRVYSPGEVEDMAPPVGEAAPEMSPAEMGDLLDPREPGAVSDLIPSVVATVRRAQKLGHAGHGNAATVEMLLRGQPVEKVRAWLTATNDDLDLMAGNPDDVPDADPKTWPAWWCATCGQKNAGWANACGRCVTVRPNPGGPAPRDWQQPHPADAVVVEDGDDGEPVPSPIRVRSEEEGGPPQWDPENLSSDALRKMAAGHRAEAASVLAEDPMADNAEDMAHQLRDEAAQFEARAREMDEFVEGLKADPAEQPGLEGVE